MMAPLPLKKISQVILPAEAAVVKHLSEENNHCDNQSSPVIVEIDFENGDLKIEGDWNSIMSCNKHAEPEWFAYHTQKVCIEMSIYPSSAINLEDENSDGLVFILEGNVKENNNSGICSGLLVLDKTSATLWHISFYIYDNSKEECEVAFKLPVYVSRPNLIFN